MQPAGGGAHAAGVAGSARSRQSRSTGALGTIAVCIFVGQRSAHTGGDDRLGNHIERALDRVGAGVVVDQGRRPGGWRRQDRTSAEARTSSSVSCLSSRHPQALEDLAEVGGGGTRIGPAARKSAVEVGMTAQRCGHRERCLASSTGSSGCAATNAAVVPIAAILRLSIRTAPSSRICGYPSVATLACVTSIAYRDWTRRGVRVRIR